MFYLLIWINEAKKIVKKNLRVMKIWSLGVKFEVKLHVAILVAFDPTQRISKFL